MSTTTKDLQNITLEELLKGSDYTKVAPGGQYEAIFNALLDKYGADTYHTALAAFTLGAVLTRREG